MQFSYKEFLIAALLIGLCGSYGYAQPSNGGTVSGTVQNAQGVPLSNIKITPSGQPDLQTRSNSDGRFTVTAKAGDRLIIETKGLQQTVTVPGSGEDVEVVVNDIPPVLNLGHGRQISQNGITGSVGVISAQDLDGKSIYSPGNALYGQATGLTVMQNSGAPSRRDPAMYIRGLSTLNNNSMMVLINGFERPLSSIVVDEIESIKVLKDAAATAIYGQRAANGVMLVTTKSGGDHKTQYNFSIEQGVTTPKKLPEFVNAPTYARAVNEALANDGMTPRYTQTEIDRYESGEYPTFYPNVNWVDEVLNNYGTMNKFNFNASGGNETIQFFVNSSYQGEEGFYNHTDADTYSSQIDMDQVNIRSTGDIQITTTSEFSVDFGMMIQNYQFPASSNILGPAYSIPSNAMPVRNFDGSWGGTNLYSQNNPVARLNDSGFTLNNKRDISLTGTLSQDLYTILEGLTGTLKLGYDNRVEAFEGESKDFQTKHYEPDIDITGEIADTVLVNDFGTNTDLEPSRGIGSLHESSTNFEARLNYKNSNGGHSLNGFVMYHLRGQQTDVVNETFRWQNIAGNVHYGFNDTYFLEASLSYQGSNRIQDADDRWGLFPAFSGAWVISNEGFLDESDVVNKLKLRGSWGQTGNGLIPIQKLTADEFGGGGGYYFGNPPNFSWGAQQTSLGIPYKTFEKANQTNIGIEARLISNLSISTDVFYEKRKDILVSSAGAASDVIGINTGLRPDGKVEKKGVEVNLGWNDQAGDLSYGISGQVSFVESKVINQNEVFRPEPYLRREGEKIGQGFGLVTNGFFADQADIDSSPTQTFGTVKPGDIKYVDQNNDGVINQFDEVPIGQSWFPNSYFSANLELGYKGFSFTALIQGAANRSVTTAWNDIYFPLTNNSNMSTWYDNYWTTENKENAELPRLTTQQNSNNFRGNDLWTRDGSFVKLRFAEVSYKLPQQLVSKAGGTNAVLYLRGRNLYTLSGIDYSDPENINSSYPSIRAYNLGLKVQF